MPQVVDDRGGDSQEDAVLHAEGDDRGLGQHCDDELAAPLGQDAPQPGQVDQLGADEEDHCGEGRDRQIAERPGERDQDDEHHRAGGELGQLAAAARTVGHLGLGGAAVDDEGARERRADVGRGQAGQVGVLAEGLRCLAA
jgi:hypothetical protein